MAILHGKGLQDLSHQNEGPDLRGSELAGKLQMSTFILGSSPGAAEKKQEKLLQCSNPYCDIN